MAAGEPIVVWEEERSRLKDRFRTRGWAWIGKGVDGVGDLGLELDLDRYLGGRDGSRRKDRTSQMGLAAGHHLDQRLRSHSRLHWDCRWD